LDRVSISSSILDGWRESSEEDKQKIREEIRERDKEFY
jgi:hypothetical protein